MWRAQVEALERYGRRALPVDLPGHGERRHERFTVPGSLAAIDDAVEQVGGRAVVVGLSLGGYLGTAWAARHPDRLAALVVSGCCTDPDRAVTDAWLLAARLIGRLPDRGRWLNQTMVDLTVPGEAAVDLAAGGFALDVMVDMLKAMRAVRPLEDLRRVRAPVWFVNGQWDHFRLQERAFLAAAPHAERRILRGASHLASLTRPVAYNRALLEALDAVDGARAPQTGGAWTSSPPPVVRRDHARTPPTIPAELGTTTTSSPIASSAAGRMRREFPPPR